MSEAARYPLPSQLVSFAGRIMDVDGHEHIPVNLWNDAFGSVTDVFRELVMGSAMGDAKSAKIIDDTPIEADNIFKIKLEEAPGAIDLKRRLEVWDYVGVDRQMIYPGNMPLMAMTFYAGADDPRVFGTLTGDRKGYARKLLDAYNDWCMRTSRISDRYRAVAILLGESPDALIAEAKRLIAGGVRAFWLPSDTPPGGYSPAHTVLDPLWALLAAANAPVLSHVGSEAGLLKTMVWRDAPEFEGWKCGEFQADPLTLTSLNLATQNFLACMIMGGVFERHPTLRFGAAEVGAYWIGPLGQTMDLWHANSRKMHQQGGASSLTMKPSEYIRRNVRVSGFDIEDISSYIDRYGMAEIYCYTADFPHLEGGKGPIEAFAKNLAGHGPDVLEKFFVTNGRLLLPD